MLPRYSVLYREAAAARCFYILLQGTLLQSKTGGPPLPPLIVTGGEVSKGLCVGTEALSKLPRQATLSAGGTCVLLQFTAAKLAVSEFDAFAIARKLFVRRGPAPHPTPPRCEASQRSAPARVHRSHRGCH